MELICKSDKYLNDDIVLIFLLLRNLLNVQNVTALQ